MTGRARAETLIRPEAVLAGLIVLGGALVVYAARDLTFYYDEFAWFEQRLVMPSWTDLLFEPHNEHLVVFPVLFFRGMAETVGMHPYWAYTLVGVLFQALCVVLAFQLVRPRVGGWTAVLLVTPLIFLGQGADTLGLWPFEITLTSSLAAMLGAFLALERGTRRADALASALLVLAVGCSGIGLAALPAVALRLGLAGPEGRRRLWVLLAPVVLYGLWYLGYGNADAQLAAMRNAPAWMIDAFAGASGALLGVGLDWGRPLAVAIAAVVLWRLARPGPVPVRLLAWIALAVTVWFLIASKRGALPPDTPRYIQVGSFALVLMLAEVLADMRVPARAQLVAAGVVGLGAWLGVNAMVADSNGFQEIANRVTPSLAALELAGERVPPGLRPAPYESPALIAGPYLAAVARWGDSPAPPAASLDRVGNDKGRVFADQVLLQARLVRFAPSGAPAGDHAQEHSLCRSVETRGRRGAATELPLPAGGLAVAAGPAPVVAHARRFGAGYGKVAVSRGIPPRGERRLVADDIAAPGRWRVRVSSKRAFSVC